MKDTIWNINYAAENFLSLKLQLDLFIGTVDEDGKNSLQLSQTLRFEMGAEGL